MIVINPNFKGGGPLKLFQNGVWGITVPPSEQPWTKCRPTVSPTDRAVSKDTPVAGRQSFLVWCYYEAPPIGLHSQRSTEKRQREDDDERERITLIAMQSQTGSSQWNVGSSFSTNIYKYTYFFNTVYEIWNCRVNRFNWYFCLH